MNAKANSTFKESESGLRDVVFDEDAPKQSWKHRLRFAPLALLAAASLAAATVGVWYAHTHTSPGGAAGAAGSVPVDFNQVTAPTMPESCGATPKADVGPWTPGVAGTGGIASTEAAQASYSAGIGSGAPGYVEGRDGYLFLSDVFNDNFSQAVGRTRPTPEGVAAWDRYMSDIEQAAADAGATPLFLVAPATWEVYSDKLPQWSDRLTGTTSLDLMRTALWNHSWVDVRPALAAARQKDPATPLYSRVNPHWSPYAAVVAWDAALDCLGDVDPALAGLPRLSPTGASAGAAPNEYEALGWGGGAPDDWASPVYETDPGAVRLAQFESADQLPGADQLDEALRGAPEVPLAAPVDFLNKPALTHNPNGRGTALVVRDSQGNNLGPALEASFEYTIQVGHALDASAPTDVAALIAAYRPSVVVVEFTQRYLALTPSTAQ